jgi:hypothetical protein
VLVVIAAEPANVSHRTRQGRAAGARPKLPAPKVASSTVAGSRVSDIEKDMEAGGAFRRAVECRHPLRELARIGGNNVRSQWQR